MEMQSPKKAVFFDIDGTLWDEEKNIPESTREAIGLLRQKGVYTFISTGRTRPLIQDHKLLSMGFDGILAGCGTYVEYKSEVLRYKALSPGLVKDSVKILKNYHMPVVLEGREYLYVDEEDFGGDPFIEFLKKDLGDKLLTIFGHEKEWEISKFSATILNDEFTKALKELEPWYNFMVHEKRVVEGIPKGFNKGTGLKVVCEALGVAHENTYAFGDSVNDLDMLEYAAHGIAMGDGMQEAKDAADYVTDGLHEDGIYNGLKVYGLI